MARFELKTLADTARLGHFLARALRTRPVPVLLSGDLGSGKTTLASALVGALPGGHLAEVSSPSFTIANIYPTKPQVIHCDLYRCQGDLPEDLLESMESQKDLVVVEWANLLKKSDMPSQWLALRLATLTESHTVQMEAQGPHAELILEELRACWNLPNV